MSTVILQSACDTCNLYIVLQRAAHRKASRVSDTASGKIMTIAEFFFELKRKSPLPATTTKEALTEAHAVLEDIKDNPTIDALKPVYDKLEGWFVLSLPGFAPTDINDRLQTDNEHNKRMLKSNKNLTENYRINGRGLIRLGKVTTSEYRLKKSELTHASMELRLQLDANQIIVDDEINENFKPLVEAVGEATSGDGFKKSTDKAITFIEGLTELRVA